MAEFFPSIGGGGVDEWLTKPSQRDRNSLTFEMAFLQYEYKNKIFGFWESLTKVQIPYICTLSRYDELFLTRTLTWYIGGGGGGNPG